MQKGTFKRQIAENIREVVFGLEDSLVSTLGAVVGIAVGSQSTFIVILSGLVILASESTSMAAGSYLSSKSAADTERNLHAKDRDRVEHQENPLRGAVVMGVFYLAGGFIPLAPFFLMQVHKAILPSIALTACSLFLVGLWASRFTKRSPVRSGVEMLSVSLAAAGIGYLVGFVVSRYFGVPLSV